MSTAIGTSNQKSANQLSEELTRSRGDYMTTFEEPCAQVMSFRQLFDDSNNQLAGGVIVLSRSQLYDREYAYCKSIRAFEKFAASANSYQNELRAHLDILNSKKINNPALTTFGRSNLSYGAELNAIYLTAKRRIIELNQAHRDLNIRITNVQIEIEWIKNHPLQRFAQIKLHLDNRTDPNSWTNSLLDRSVRHWNRWVWFLPAVVCDYLSVEIPPIYTAEMIHTIDRELREETEERARQLREETQSSVTSDRVTLSVPPGERGYFVGEPMQRSNVWGPNSTYVDVEL